MDVILDWVRNSARHGTTRTHPTLRQDMRSFASAFNICNAERLHGNDARTVTEWVTRQRQMEDGIVMFCKLQNEEPTVFYELQDFAVFIMSPPQAELLQKFGNSVICIDTVYGTAVCSFQLTVLMTVDEFGESVPCAFCISSRMDAAVMVHFFSCVKQKVGELHAASFMSDDRSQCYGAWEAVMGTPSNRWLCSWHVDRDWRDNIVRYVQGGILEATVYKSCRHLLEFEDENSFPVLCSDFLKKVGEMEGTKEFAVYFQQHYANRLKLWALCYRESTVISADMCFESLHRSVEHLCLKGTHRKRIGSLISCLLRLTHDKLHDRIAKLSKGGEMHRNGTISQRHIASLSIPSSAIKVIKGEYKVESQTTPDTTYTVARGTEMCDCQLMCYTCKVCVHSFTCTCDDYLVMLNMCKHIHAVARLTSPNENSCDNAEVCETVEVEFVVGENGDLHQIQEDTLSETTYLFKAKSVSEELVRCLKSGNISESQAKKVYECLEKLLKDMSVENPVTEPAYCAWSQHLQPHTESVMRMPTVSEKLHLLDGVTSFRERTDDHDYVWFA